MKIKVQEIPENGKNYLLTRETAELNDLLKDLIGQNPYNVGLFIKPMSTKDYQITGTIDTVTNEQCSLCAEDFDYKINKKIVEYLIPFQEDDRKSHYSRTSVDMSDDVQDMHVTTYRGGQFEMGEFVHEAIAFEVPFNPKCEACSKNNSLAPFKYDEKMDIEVKKNPFETLKGIKLN